ncbi:MAG: chemotaxis response regulator protein-glutamate methylesterase [Rhodospirillales bacterium]|nr:MAG: chemotaxis response regulator protein-glutamate methylesterase [Rhodospirillales bacterium]
MVVDDSVVIRGLISRILEGHPGIRVVASAANGRLALDVMQRQTIDVVVLDIEMPVMDGITTLPELLKLAPGIKVIIASTLSTRNADISIRCLEAGAADYVPKPTASRDISGAGNGSDAFRREILDKVLTHGAIRRGRLPGNRDNRAPSAVAGNVRPERVPQPVAAAPKPITLRPPGLQRPQLLAVGSSTGGPQALRAFLGGLGPGFDLPILVSQHMPPTFTAILAQHLAGQTGRRCTEARDGEPLAGGEIRIAPGDHHMRIGRDGRGAKILKLAQDPPQNFCRPSVDPLFASAAETFGPAVLAVVLTGMGSDGLAGARAVIESGGTVIAQDERSSVVWGMPGAVAEAGLCAAVLPLMELAGFARTLSGRQKR